MKNFVRLWIPLFASACFFVFGISRILCYGNYRSLEIQNSQLKENIETGDHIDDHEEAVKYYKILRPLIPEVNLRILQRQWKIALDILKQIQTAKRNAYLEKDVPMLYDKLAGHLEDMKDRCDFTLAEFASLQEDICWQVLNIRGSVRLLASFIVLETEKNWKKVKGTMKEAIVDLRNAVDTVDKTYPTTYQKNIPRWNLELLQGEQFVKMIRLTTMEAERRLELRDNLEAIIPEKGGYAPGEPVERKMKK